METKYVRKPEHKNGCVFLWKIRNYRLLCLDETGYIESPRFLIPVLKGECQIRLCSLSKDNLYCLFIANEKFCVDHEISVDFSILTTKGYQNLCKKNFELNLERNLCKIFENWNKEDIVKEDSIFILEDTLTLRFHFSDESRENEPLIMYSALTEFENQRFVFRLPFNPINEHSVGKRMSRIVESSSMEIPQWNVTLYFENDFTSHTYIDIMEGISIDALIIKISVVCTDGNLRHISKKCNGFISRYNGTSLSNDFSLNQLLKEEKLYLPNGILTLQCELIFPTGAVRSRLEEYNFIPNFSENQDVEIRQKPLHTAESDSNIPEVLEEGLVSLREDLRNILREQKLCDAVVRAGGREFPVHKAILCARSPVFSSMFELDMKEKRSGQVQIDDVDSETVEMFLNYLYTGSVNSLKLDSGMTLYSVADKCQVAVLKKECCSSLLSELSEQNVCDILIFADLHQDTSLKLAAQEVFCAHSKNVLLSKEWINLIQKFPNLAAEVLQVMATKM